MAKENAAQTESPKRKAIRWTIRVFVITIVISSLMSLASEAVLSDGNIFLSFFVLLAIVAVGIVFDAVGVAVTSASEKPFHSMASRKVAGAKEAIMLLRNAGQVSSFCNDVIGDICGVVSGSASAAIAAKVLNHFTASRGQIVTLVMSSLIAGLTVGGKAIGKAYALESCTQIVHAAGRLIAFRNRVLPWFSKKK